MPSEDRLLEVVEQPANVEVAPRRVGRQRARTPDADAAAGERADAVDADRVEQVVLVLVICVSSEISAADDLVRRRLVHAAGVVVAGPDAGDVPGRRQERCAVAGSTP